MNVLTFLMVLMNKCVRLEGLSLILRKPLITQTFEKLSSRYAFGRTKPTKFNKRSNRNNVYTRRVGLLILTLVKNNLAPFGARFVFCGPGLDGAIWPLREDRNGPPDQHGNLAVGHERRLRWLCLSSTSRSWQSSTTFGRRCAPLSREHSTRLYAWDSYADGDVENSTGAELDRERRGIVAGRVWFIGI